MSTVRNADGTYTVGFIPEAERKAEATVKPEPKPEKKPEKKPAGKRK